MRNIKIALQYEGTRYLGWQRLKDQDSTIQGKLEDLLNKMTDEEVQVIGCSRTDKGVHAKSLIANFHTNSKMTLHEIQTYMNYYLPEDIRVTYIEEADDKFHARHNAKTKVYRFTIDNNSFADVFTRKTAIHQPKQLDIKAMEKAANYLIGTHDYDAFTTMKSKKKSCRKSIKSIAITKKNNYVYLEFEGEGFLHNMIRIITGTLIRVGTGEISPEELANILASKDRSLSGPMVEGKGLMLMHVNY